jgi:hypothetical protein
METVGSPDAHRLPTPQHLDTLTPRHRERMDDDLAPSPMPR